MSTEIIGRYKPVVFASEQLPTTGMYSLGIDSLTNNLAILNSAGVKYPVAASGMAFLVTGGGTDLIYNAIITNIILE